MPKVSRASLKKAAQVANKLKGKGKSKSQDDDVLPPVTPKFVVEQCRLAFAAERNTKNASQMKKYMRGQYEFFGIMTPKRKELSKEILLSCGQFEMGGLHALLKLLWQQPERDFQMFGLDVCDRHIKTLFGHSEADSLKSLMVMKELIETKSWWDTVDMLASKSVGRLVSGHRKSFSKIMDAWIEDEDLWVRRTAILHQLNYKDKTDQDQLFRFCTLRANEEDFFIRKAIGWALRQHARTYPDAVRTFVKKHEDELSPLSKKEAMKHL